MWTLPKKLENSSSKKALQNKLDYKEFLDGKREGFCGNLCQLKGKTVTDARQCIVEHTEKILKEIENSRGSIRSFIIGKSCVKGTPINNEEFSKWKYDNINERWTSYGAKDKGYNCLIVLCGFTDDSLPCKDVFPDDETQQPTNKVDAERIQKKIDTWALAFEQYLIQYFALQKEDPRIDNDSLYSGAPSPEEAWCSVVYIAVKLKDVRFNNFDELLKHKRKGYTANLCTELKGKTPESAESCLFRHCIATLNRLRKKRGIIKKITIGRSHATYRKSGEEKVHLSTREFSTWNVTDSIGLLWESLENDNCYDVLVVLCGIKKSDTDQDQHDFTKSVLERLKESLTRFNGYNNREELDNEEETNNGAICATLYVAVMFGSRGKNAKKSTQSTESRSADQSDSKKGSPTEKGPEEVPEATGTSKPETSFALTGQPGSNGTSNTITALSPQSDSNKGAKKKSAAKTSPQKETIKDTDNTTPLPASKGTSKEA